MRSEYSPKGKHQAILVCFLGYLSASVSVISVLLFVVVSSCFNVLWIVPIMSEVRKNGARTGPMFSNPVVLLTLYPLLSFRPRLFIYLAYS
jgi:hypothetical protein